MPHEPPNNLKRQQGRQAPPRVSRQFAKSDAMRTLVLETTIECLAQRPYSEVSSSLIAERAGVSRGGLQYHFATHLALLQATVVHLHDRRLTQFRTDMLARPADRDVFDHLIDSHWSHLNERDFRAYQELVLAGRSHPELARLLASHYGAFLTEWHRIARETFGWDTSLPQVARAGNVAHYLLEGMAFGRLGGQFDQAVMDDLLAFAKEVLRDAVERSRSLPPERDSPGN